MRYKRGFTKMKVKHFLKRRIFPVMLSLVIVFFSVVIPCARVEASSLVVPAPAAGFSYYDLVSSAFLSTGFDCPLQKSDGTRTTFGKEMYDELCDTFDLWCNDNFGTTDASEIKEQLRALPGNIANGAVTIGKKLWEGLKGFASDAYDKSIDFLSSFSDALAKDASYAGSSSGSLSWNFVKAVTGCIPSGWEENDAILSGNYFVIGKGMTVDGEFCYFLARSNVWSYNTFCIGRDNINNLLDLSFSDHWIPQMVIWSTSGNVIVNKYDYFGYDLSDVHILCTNCSSIRYSVDGNSTYVSVPDLANDVIWPKETLAVDKVVTGPTTWEDAIAKDIIVPGEAADTAVIGLTHTDEDSDVIPGTATGDVTEDPSVSDDAKPDVNEIVSSEEISSFPEKVKKAVGDVTNLFPFCIPFDIVRLIRGMEAEQKPPVWHFEYYFEEIDYTFVVDIDMTDYEKYIKIFRAGIVIFWIIALMLITIRFSSGIVKD